jgi:hypothetical protein
MHKTSARPYRGRRRTLHCESLEARRLLTTFTVNDLGDTPDANPGDGIAEDAAGNTTLRTAIEEANALAGADDIMFSVAGNIPLTTGAQLEITDDLIVDGGGAISIDGELNNRVILIDNGDSILNSINVELKNLTVTRGFSSLGSGIRSYESVDLNNVTVTGNIAEQPNLSYEAYGAGILNAGDMTIVGSQIVNNEARDPVGLVQGNANGGGISNYQTDATLTLVDTVVSGNVATGWGGGIFGQQNTVTISQSEISNNHSGAADLYGGYGGGVSMLSTAYGVPNGEVNLEIVDSLISGNSTIIDSLTYYRFPYGGGVYAGGHGTVNITNTTIENNTVSGAEDFFTPLARGGGAFFGGFGAYGAMTVEISGSTIDGNTALGQGGGVAMRGRNDSPVTVTISDSVVSNNSAQSFQGGAFFTWQFLDTQPGMANLIVQDSTVTGNFADDGGGVSMTWFGGNANFERSTLDGNYGGSVRGGGAILNLGTQLTAGRLPPTVYVIDSTVSNNTSAGTGGGLYSYDGILNVVQSTITGNSASGPGGGAYLKIFSGYIGTPYENVSRIDRSTVTNNYTANSGGGLYLYYYGTHSVTDSIISGNSNSTGFSPDIYDGLSLDATVGFAYNFVGNNSGTLLPAANPDANGNIVGDAAMPLDAMLGGLADNGGSTLTHLPMPGSPVIDVADPMAVGVNDQRGGGFTRIVNGRMDMGSVEFAEPSVDGDFNNDGLWDCTDINLLTAAVASGMNDLDFDMNGDGVVDGISNPMDVTNDIVAWLQRAGMEDTQGVTGGNPFVVGDANLDGVADGLDFIQWNNGKFTINTDWCGNDNMPMVGGNFNGDGVIDGLDFILWNAFKFTGSMDSAAGLASGATLGEATHRALPQSAGKDSLASGALGRMEVRTGAGAGNVDHGLAVSHVAAIDTTFAEIENGSFSMQRIAVPQLESIDRTVTPNTPATAEHDELFRSRRSIAAHRAGLAAQGEFAPLGFDG